MNSYFIIYVVSVAHHCAVTCKYIYVKLNSIYTSCGSLLRPRFIVSITRVIFSEFNHSRYNINGHYNASFVCLYSVFLFSYTYFNALSNYQTCRNLLVIHYLSIYNLYCAGDRMNN